MGELQIQSDCFVCVVCSHSSWFLPLFSKVKRVARLHSRTKPSMKGGGSSITPEARKIIEGIKEIVKGYNDEDIYEMLHECNMDPNETAQKLLTQGPFHEVKRKRDKKKENTSIQNSMDARPRSGNQGRGGRGGSLMGRGSVRASYRPILQDIGGGKGSNARENGTYKIANKIDNSAIPTYTNDNVQAKECASGTSSLPVSANGIPTGLDVNLSCVRSPCASKEEQSAGPGHTTMADILKSSSLSQLPAQPEITSVSPTSSTVPGQPAPKFQQQTIVLTPISAPGVCSSLPDPVYVPSPDVRVSGVVGTIKRVLGTVGAQRGTDTPSTFSPSSLSETLQTKSNHADVSNGDAKVSANNSDSAVVNPAMDDNHSRKSITSDGDRLFEPKPQASISVTHGASANNPSVMGKQYNSRPQQQPVGPQKAIGPNMEWKRKPPNQITASKNPGVINSNTGSASVAEISTPSLSPPNAVIVDDGATKLPEKLEQLNVRNDQHLILPNHLQVPEAAFIGLSFGSFGAFFGSTLSTEFGKGGSDKSSTPLSETSQKTEDSNEEPSSRTSDPSPESPSEHQEQTSPNADQSLSSGIDITDSIAANGVSQSDPSKQDRVVQLDPQYSPVETAPSYASVGLMPQIMGSQYHSYEPALSSPLDASRQPGLVMQQPYDPSTSCYSQFLRPGDGDARFNPFAGATAMSKYNGNATFLSGQSVSASQETGSSAAVSSAGPTAPGTQMAGVAQTTVSFPQQQMHLFPQPGGVHISHFPQYIPYPHQYFSPFYISPPPAINNFAGNIGYPQPSTGTNYPLPSGNSFPSAAAAMKYSLSQFKPMTGGGNSSQTGFPVGYASYTASPSGFSASPAVTGGSRSGFEENKETNLYIPSQQVDGSAVWFRTPQNLSGMQSNSYYSLTAQGQNVAFAPTQSGHAAYAGLYHPAQSGVAQNSPQLLQQSEPLGAAAGGNNSQTGGYQQSQPGQLNWSNNY